MSEFTFTLATRENSFTPIIMAIAGPSGGGKTYTALEIAMGLAGESGKTVLIDTEGKRSLYYADLKVDPERRPDLAHLAGQKLFRFYRCPMTPPYTPDRFLDAMKAAATWGASVIIADSFSDEYTGEGGLVDMAAAERVPNDAAKWAKPKAKHKLVVRWVRNSCPCHLIFAMRAEEKVKLVKVMKDNREQTAVEPQGFQPICEKAWMFDMMESFLLTPDRRGIPQWIKPLEQHLPFFPTDRMVTREAGRRLAEWAAGGATVTPSEHRAQLDINQRAEQATKLGSDKFREFYLSLTDDDKLALRPIIRALQAKAQFGRPPLTEPIRRGLGGESQPEGGRPGEEKPPAPPEPNSQRSDMAAAGVAERRSDANSGGRHVTEPREPSDRAGEALSPGSSDPPPASPAVIRNSDMGIPMSEQKQSVKAGAAPPIAIVKPHGGEPDWPATRKLLVEAFYDLMTIADCDAFRERHSATINALSREAPDEFEIWDTLAATHERVRRVLQGER